MARFIPLSVPNFEGNEKKYVDEALSQGWVSTGGAYITKLEESLQDFLGVDKVAACQSGTSALHLALIGCGVRPGDLVIVPALTFIAAVNPVRYQFADPVFMDCDESLCMDPEKLRAFCRTECVWKDGHLRHKATDRPVKAVIVVHVFGNMADMEAIMEIARAYHLKVIEDATEALGTHYTAGKYENQYAGTIGDYGAFSFNGNKIITTGGGGAATAHSPEAVNYMRYLSTQAKDDAQFYIHNEVGFNYRMTNLQAALGVAQMEELPEFIRRKQANYDLYRELFDGFEMGRMIEFRQGTASNKWFYSLEVDKNKVKADLREIVVALEKKGVQTRTVWGLINEQLPYQKDIAYKLEKASFYAGRILNFPSGTQITREEIRYVAEQLKDTLSHC